VVVNCICPLDRLDTSTPSTVPVRVIFPYTSILDVGIPAYAAVTLKTIAQIINN
jgi:hypothetical protein